MPSPTPQNTSLVRVPVNPDTKAAWIKISRQKGLKLGDWVRGHVLRSLATDRTSTPPLGVIKKSSNKAQHLKFISLDDNSKYQIELKLLGDLAELKITGINTSDQISDALRDVIGRLENNIS